MAAKVVGAEDCRVDALSGQLAALENECCTWTPDEDESPNRMDALVWAITELQESGPVVVVSPISFPKLPMWQGSSGY